MRKKIKMEPHVKNKVVAARPVWPFILATILLVMVGSLIYSFRHARTRNIVSGFVSNPESNLETTDGRTNVLFLGLGGEGHDAPELTDSMILMSLKHTDHSITLLSIPRDIWVDSFKDKVNKAYKYGNDRREGAGKDLAKSVVHEITDIPVHYVLTLDFKGFIKAIDAVGGVDVTVERAFDDYKYPIPGKENAEPESDRYQHLHFDAGPTHMDGITALQFARSRHALGEEGTDFARSARQQKIIYAFKDKMLQSKTFLNIDTLKNVAASFSDSIDTDIQENDYGSFVRFFLAFQDSGTPMKTISIESLFSNPKNTRPYYGQWVLIPTRDWQEIHDHVKANLQ